MKNIIISLNEKITWLDIQGYVKGYEDVTFYFEEGEDRGFIKSKVKEQKIIVPIINGVQILQDYKEYIRGIESFFHDRFKHKLLYEI